MAKRIVELEATVQNEREECAEACKASFTEGLAKGKAEAEREDEKRIILLREGIAAAIADCATGIDARGDTAVSITRAAIAKILGEESAYAGMVEHVVRNQTRLVHAGALLKVRVSTQDFPHAEAVAEIGAAHDGVRIERDAKLLPGACLFELSLGTLDASIPLQTRAVDELLAPFEASRIDAG